MLGRYFYCIMHENIIVDIYVACMCLHVCNLCMERIIASTYIFDYKNRYFRKEMLKENHLAR